MIWDILSLEVAPGLRRCHLRPHVVEAIVERLLCRNPIVGPGTETLTFVRGFFPAGVVQPVGKEPVSAIGKTGGIPGPSSGLHRHLLRFNI